MEIGKKYKSTVSDIVYECVFAGTILAVLRSEGTEFAVGPSFAILWKEHHEPVIKKKWGILTEQSATTPWRGDHLSSHNVEATFTDGKLTKLEILK